MICSTSQLSYLTHTSLAESPDCESDWPGAGIGGGGAGGRGPVAVFASSATSTPKTVGAVPDV